MRVGSVIDRGAPRDSPFPIFLCEHAIKKVADRTGEVSRRPTDGEEMNPARYNLGRR